MSAHNFMVMHPIVVEVFQPGPEVIDQPLPPPACAAKNGANFSSFVIQAIKHDVT